MGTAPEGDRPQSPREFYGEELRLKREAAGLTQEELGERVICSGSLIAHFEAGRRKPHPDLAKRLDEVLGTGTFFVRMRRTLTTAWYPDHFVVTAEAEQRATVIEQYGSTLVPGLLQTEAYARAVFRAYRPDTPADEIDELVVNRLKRAVILADHASPRVWVIVSENVIRTVVGGPAVMAEQLDYVAGLARSGRIILQVVPHSAGAHATMSSALKLMIFEDEPDLAYVEGTETGTLYEEPATVQRYRHAYNLARAAALPLRASSALIEAVQKEYAGDC